MDKNTEAGKKPASVFFIIQLIRQQGYEYDGQKGRRTEDKCRVNEDIERCGFAKMFVVSD